MERLEKVEMAGRQSKSLYEESKGPIYYPGGAGMQGN